MFGSVLRHFPLGDAPLTARLAARRDAWKARRNVTAGTRVDNLAQLGKAITLCKGGCERKFSARKNGYQVQDKAPFADGVIADCDGCMARLVPANLFLKASA